MRALDLFCGAGGASRGLADAGYEVVGVDVSPQPNYPYEFVLGSAIEVDVAWASTFDLIWASPPCQKFSAYRRRDPSSIGETALNLIPATRRLLHATRRPWIMENVPNAPLMNPVMLCGSMFNLDIRRHRWFETSSRVPQPACHHERHDGTFPCAGNRVNPRKTIEVGVRRIPLDVQRRAMGIDWMKLRELSKAVPPAYAEYLARRVGPGRHRK